MLAREISKALRARAPKIVAAPELLDRWVGGSEKLVRELFAEAEAELAACGGDVRKSALHVVVIDEIDAVFRKRSVAEDSGEATRSSAVNQILAKMDGVNSLPNVLLIGMTNRPELLDEALLRPGRLEVQIEIPRPNREGRREILQIHFGSLRKSGRLSQPLCHAIDGSKRFNDGIMSKRKMLLRAGKLKELLRNSLVGESKRRIFDLACDSVTGGFSGECYSYVETWLVEAYIVTKHHEVDVLLLFIHISVCRCRSCWAGKMCRLYSFGKGSSRWRWCRRFTYNFG